MMSGRNFIFTLACLCALQTAGGAERDGTSARSDQNLSDLPVLRPDLRSGFANGAWKYDRYKQLEYDLSAHAGQTVGLVIRVAAGGPKGQWANEEAFFDEISVVSE